LNSDSGICSEAEVFITVVVSIVSSAGIELRKRSWLMLEFSLEASFYQGRRPQGGGNGNTHHTQNVRLRSKTASFS
jgi:hypothetical protein